LARIHPALATLAVLVLALPASSSASNAEEPVDLAMVSRIRDEGFRHSQVMETVRQLTDGLGPRLTGSPQLKEANEWTRHRLEEWGLANAHLEPYPFGRGWSFSRAAVHMIKPQAMPLHALPKAYTPGTDGPVRGPVVIAVLKKEADFEAWKGKLAGKIVLLDEARDLSKTVEAKPREYSEEGLHDLEEYEIPEERDPVEYKKAIMARSSFRLALTRFLADEKPLAVLEPSFRPWGVLRVTRSGSYKPDESVGVPSLVMASEQYNRLYRMTSEGKEVELEVEVAARFHDEDRNAYNTVAEIPGLQRGEREELVMVGAHLDSWHTGSGATDNAAGCAIVMEAMRILKALKVKPKRTIRVALWTGEEQGLYGSVAYVTDNFGSWSGPEDPEHRALIPSYAWQNEGTLRIRPGHARLSAYFNVDNGGGRIRGIYAESNSAVKPIFDAWLAPFHDLGADTVTLRSTEDTDHEAFVDVGLPGFQFIQDELDYSARTHHSDMDVYDHLQREDLVQASVVLASFLYHAAMRPEKLPRLPLPEPNAPQPQP
jgi:carboxypeptidase Q